MSLTWPQVLMLLVFLAVCFAAAGLGGWFTSQSVGTWYQELRKPAWNPPSWVFSPVWTTLYAAMAVAAWLVWRAAPWPASAYPLALFAVQLALNVTWSYLFFALRSPALAFVELLLLWLAILATTVAFWRVTPAAGWLFVPYLAWTSFAATLNAAIWRLNP